jgi:AcrR family transcriptional regulator
MSTNDVVRRAGVSRGALVHHYPTKAQLAVAALDRWLGDRLVDFEAAFAMLPPEQRTSDVAIDVLWTLFQGETFAAWLELTVAARTDPDLRTRLAEVNRRFDEGVLATFNRTFPPATDTAPDPGVAVRFAFTVLTGTAVNRILEGPDAADPPESVTTLKFIASALANDLWSNNS